jgi:hypothetical protein
MASYITITDAETDPEAPLTSELAKKWRDNPIAIAEGETGAPKIVSKAMDLFLGTFSFSATPAGLTGLDGEDGLLIWYGVTNTSGAAALTLEVRFSNDNGSTWGSYQSIGPSQPATSSRNGFAILGLKTGRFRSTHNLDSQALVSSTLTVPSNCNAFQIRANGGTASGGTAYVLGIGETQ